MHQTEQRLRELFKKWTESRCSEQELEELYQYCSQDSSADVLKDMASQLWNSLPTFPVDQSTEAKQLADNIIRNGASKRSSPAINISSSSGIVRHLANRWSRYAAAIILCLTIIGGYLWNQRQSSNEENITTVNVFSDIAPGKGGAILTLADGSQILLDSANIDTISVQGYTQATLADGQLTYHSPHNTTDTNEPEEYNTLTTPPGYQFSVVLPDGTKVWLNAASTLNYPTVFNGKRRVELTGEAYFEVTPNKNAPFLVSVNKQSEIEVLGTSFNIHAYTNEPVMHTTLITGKVKVHAIPVSTDRSFKNSKGNLLKPGQQIALPHSSSSSSPFSSEKVIRESIKTLDPMDIEKVLAWKNGIFNFENASLEEVMRQIARWYDLDIIYEKGIPPITFGGQISRNVSLRSLLKGLEDAQVHFRLEAGRRLVVLP